MLLVHSQTDGIQVTSEGVGMQTFSVTKQVAMSYLQTICMFRTRSIACIHMP